MCCKDTIFKIESSTLRESDAIKNSQKTRFEDLLIYRTI